jgi:hypothetical protein
MNELNKKSIEEVNGGFDGLFPEVPIISSFPWIKPAIIPVIWK